MAYSADDRDIRVGADARAGRGASPAAESLRREFPYLETPSSRDLSVVERQISRQPRGRVLVAARCPRGLPAVIFTPPFEADGDRMPPLLWLSCPSAARETARLESEGAVAGFAERLRAERGALELFTRDEERFARAFSLAASGSREAFAERLGERGVAGGRKGAVKCLHAHVAYRLAAAPSQEPETRLSVADQPVEVADPPGLLGRWCVEELEKRSGLWCERIPEACVD